MKNFGLFNQSEKIPGTLDPWAMLLPVIFDLVCGLLLIFLGNLATLVTSYALAGLMIIYAVWLLITYTRSSTMEKITEFRLAGGLALLFSGVLLAFSPKYMEELLPFIWGLAMFFGAFVKVQYAFGEKLLGIQKWWIMLIFAGFSLAIGILTLVNPAFLGDSRAQIIGILLVAETVLDVVVFVMINNALKKSLPTQEQVHEAIQSAPVQQPEAAAAVPEAVPSAPAQQPVPAPAAPEVLQPAPAQQPAPAAVPAENAPAPEK